MRRIRRHLLMAFAGAAGVLACALLSLQAQWDPPEPAMAPVPDALAANSHSVYVLQGDVLRAFSSHDLSPAAAARLLPPAGPGPWNHDLLLYAGADGSAFSARGAFAEASGVPSLIRDAKARLIAVFQWFPADDPDHFDRVAVKVSADGGRSWEAPVPIEVAGLPDGSQRPFDPTLALLPDGRIRLYFSSGPAQGGHDEMATYSALSSDGIHYAFEPGARFAVPGRRVIDCAVLRLGEQWHYYAPIGRPEEGAYHAVSGDGLHFTRMPDIPSVDGVNWTGNLVAYGDGMRFYGGSRRGIWWAFSRDGATWSRPNYLGFQGGDPAVVQAPDGGCLLICVSMPRGASITPPR